MLQGERLAQNGYFLALIFPSFGAVPWWPRVSDKQPGTVVGLLHTGSLARLIGQNHHR